VEKPKIPSIPAKKKVSLTLSKPLKTTSKPPKKEEHSSTTVMGSYDPPAFKGVNINLKRGKVLTSEGFKRLFEC